MVIFSGKKAIGALGEIDLAVTQKLIKNTAFGFELYPEDMSCRSKIIELKPISKFPSSTRDINILISKSHTYQMVENTLNAGSISFLNSFVLVNTFEGKGIPDGLISMTLSFTFQSSKKSLKDSEINDSMTHVLRALKKSLGAEIRS